MLESVPPLHEGQAVYSQSQGDSTVAPEYSGGKGSGGGHRTGPGPIWDRRPVSAPRRECRPTRPHVHMWEYNPDTLCDD